MITVHMYVPREREKLGEQRLFSEKFQKNDALPTYIDPLSLAPVTANRHAEPARMTSVSTNKTVHSASSTAQTSGKMPNSSSESSASHTDLTLSPVTKSVFVSEIMQNSPHSVSSVAQTSVVSLNPSLEYAAKNIPHTDPTLSSVKKSMPTYVTMQNNSVSSRAQTSATLATQKSSYEQPLCKLSNCVDLLTLQEQNRLKICEKQTVKYMGHQLPNPTCRFMRGGTSQGPVALNSQEGSGNSWLRGLLEKATGICTGFYACDWEMRARGFLGESIQSARVLVVKTHVHIPKWIGEKSIATLSYESSYGSAIFLIRNPAHGMIAEWNRLNNKVSSKDSHTNVVSKEEFGMCVFVDMLLSCLCEFIPL